MRDLFSPNKNYLLFFPGFMYINDMYNILFKLARELSEVLK